MERICVIGAGASGLAAAKTLHERGLAFDVFEMSSGVGGLWRYDNDNGRAAAYESLHINTSRDVTGFSDFPIPKSLPHFLHHRQLLDYFERYVERFGFGPTIRFRTRVEHVAPAAAGGYDVTTRDLATGETQRQRYGAVLVANGHHWDPALPEIPGTFGGVTLHSHAYRTPEIFEGRRVLVVGVGNSGCDIACEATRHAAATFLSARRGAHVIPRYLLGRPLDAWVSAPFTRLPIWLQRAAYASLILLERGPQRRYGFPRPPYRLGQEHPTVSSELLPLVRDGAIQVRPEIERLDGRRVHFRDGTTEAVDVIVFATGYRVTFEFFDPGFLTAEANRLPLYLHVVPPERAGLYFIGLIQPVGAVVPLAEAQARWVADLLDGTAALPPAAEMHAAIARQTAAMQQRYVASPRHTMEVDFYPYLRALEKERRQGRKRLRTQNAPSAPAQATHAKHEM